MAGWLLLSDQLSTYRFLDKLEQNRHNDELVVDNSLLRREAEELVARYNQLLAQANELYWHATEVASDSARKYSVIAELEHRAQEHERATAALELECERLRLENRTKDGEIRLLYGLVRQYNPDFYLPE
jgi:hypothetical protein